MVSASIRWISPSAPDGGCYVANVPDYCIDEVATHALTLTLNWARKLPIAQQTIKNGHWDIAPLRPLQSAQDQVLGLLGFGRIAQALCRMSRAIRISSVGQRSLCREEPHSKKRSHAGFTEALDPRRRLYFASSAAHPKTRHIIDATTLQAMKPTAYLVNTARGELVDETALGLALKKGWIAGAAIDVTEKEPLSQDHPLRSIDNVVITPHCAWYTERSQKTLRQKACAEVIRVLRGGVPKNLVNKAALR